jgi:hypothetical protein
MGMIEEKRARIAMVAPMLQPGEKDLWDVGAIWHENPDILGPRDGEGFLVLTDRRVLFGTPRLGVLLDLPLDAIEANMAKDRRNMAILVLQVDGKNQMTFWTGKKSARKVVDAVLRSTKEGGL